MKEQKTNKENLKEKKIDLNNEKKWNKNKIAKKVSNNVKFNNNENKKNNTNNKKINIKLNKKIIFYIIIAIGILLIIICCSCLDESFVGSCSSIYCVKLLYVSIKYLSAAVIT